MIFQAEAWLTPCQRRHQPFVQLQHNLELQLFPGWGVTAWTYELPRAEADCAFSCTFLLLQMFYHLKQKQPGHMAVSFSSILLHNWMQHCTAVRDLGNLSLSLALTASFLSQGERRVTGTGSWWILRFHSPVLPWAASSAELCCLEKFCTGATLAWGPQLLLREVPG